MFDVVLIIRIKVYFLPTEIVCFHIHASLLCRSRALGHRKVVRALRVKRSGVSVCIR